MHKSKLEKHQPNIQDSRLGVFGSGPANEKCLCDSDAECTTDCLFRGVKQGAGAGRKRKLPKQKDRRKAAAPRRSFLVCRPLLSQDVKLVFRH
jgi:hypothetical protein